VTMSMVSQKTSHLIFCQNLGNCRQIFKRLPLSEKWGCCVPFSWKSCRVSI